MMLHAFFWLHAMLNAGKVPLLKPSIHINLDHFMKKLTKGYENIENFVHVSCS